MSVMSTVGRTAAAAALALAAIGASAGPASAGPTRAAAPSQSAYVPCTVNYVCVQAATTSAIVRIPSGTRKVFPAGFVMSGATNLTRLNYCFIGSPSFSLRPGATIQRVQRVMSAGPGAYCPL